MAHHSGEPSEAVYSSDEKRCLLLAELVLGIVGIVAAIQTFAMLTPHYSICGTPESKDSGWCTSADC